MIARDHDRVDAGIGTDTDGGGGFGTWRIHHPDEAEQRHMLFRAVERRAGLTRNRQDTKAFACHPPFDAEHPLATFVGQRHLAVVAEEAGATRHDVVGRSFRVSDRAGLCRVQRRHPATLGGEGDFGDAWFFCGQAVRCQSHLDGRDYQSALGGIALDVMAAVACDEAGIRGECRRA